MMYLAIYDDAAAGSSLMMSLMVKYMSSAVQDSVMPLTDEGEGK